MASPSSTDESTRVSMNGGTDEVDRNTSEPDASTAAEATKVGAEQSSASKISADEVSEAPNEVKVWKYTSYGPQFTFKVKDGTTFVVDHMGFYFMGGDFTDMRAGKGFCGEGSNASHNLEKLALDEAMPWRIVLDAFFEGRGSFETLFNSSFRYWKNDDLLAALRLCKKHHLRNFLPSLPLPFLERNSTADSEWLETLREVDPPFYRLAKRSLDWEASTLAKRYQSLETRTIADIIASHFS